MRHEMGQTIVITLINFVLLNNKLILLNKLISFGLLDVFSRVQYSLSITECWFIDYSFNPINRFQ
jgi:hypothetical protein